MDAVTLLVEATDFAARKHSRQRRKDSEKTPYINHPIGVARILKHEGNVSDPVVLAAALLHDTVEDTDTTLDEIEALFGREIMSVVAEVTDEKGLPTTARKQAQVVSASGKSARAKLVKLADKLYNLRDLNRCLPDGWSEARRAEYFRWACSVVRGLRGSNEALERALDKLFEERGLCLVATVSPYATAEECATAEERATTEKSASVVGADGQLACPS